MTPMPDPREIERCAGLLREGRVVAIPTETVYGLAAHALDREAVERVFALKGRPRTSPLIVHVPDTAAARVLASTWPEAAERLAARFWPGPLTLIVPKAPSVPDLVTAGLPTVGLRVPGHPVAHALLVAAGVPVAAPSANPFTRLSATTAAHVQAAFPDGLDAVLDAGPTEVGIESSVVSFASGTPRLLRPGAIPARRLREVVPELVTADELPAPAGAHESPGQHRRHYSPRTRLVVIGPDQPLPEGAGVWLHHGRPRSADGVRDVRLPPEPGAYAATLYATLHALDAEGHEWIAVQRPPTGEAWDAIRDRLGRASAV